MKRYFLFLRQKSASKGELSADCRTLSQARLGYVDMYVHT
jgi:hypothetical protein